MKAWKLIVVIVIVVIVVAILMQPESLTRIRDAWNVEKEYYENGVVKTATLTMSEEELKCTHSYYPSGKLHKKYCKDLSENLQGPFEEFFENGNTKEISIAIDNNIHGISKMYHENGMIKDSFHYSHGLRDGFFISYYDNGKVEVINYFNNDILTHKKVFRYDSLWKESIYETYNPIVSLSSDTINYGDTLTASFRLPLDENYSYYADNLVLRFDFHEVTAEDTVLNYPSMIDSIVDDTLERSFIIEDEGDHMVYGFLEGTLKDSSVQYETFEKRFYVRGE